MSVVDTDLGHAMLGLIDAALESQGRVGDPSHRITDALLDLRIAVTDVMALDQIEGSVDWSREARRLTAPRP
jgi:hypothetical protein